METDPESIIKFMNGFIDIIRELERWKIIHDVFTDYLPNLRIFESIEEAGGITTATARQEWKKRRFIAIIARIDTEATGILNKLEKEKKPKKVPDKIKNDIDIIYLTQEKVREAWDKYNKNFSRFKKVIESKKTDPDISKYVLNMLESVERILRMANTIIIHYIGIMQKII